MKNLINPYKDGDIIVHIEGKGEHGAGWEEGAIWKVNTTRVGCSLDVVWTDKGCGVYTSCVRYATALEVAAFNKGIKSIFKIPEEIPEKTYEIY